MYTQGGEGRERARAIGLRGLHDLRATRRRRFVAELEWIDALYRAYLTAIFLAAAVVLVSGVLGDKRATPAALHDITAQGPAVIGILIAIGVALALRSGGRGGPLAIEAADVHHVLLSPVDRGVALRGIALRQLRTAAFLGIVIGLIAANLAFRRLPGEPAVWLTCGAVFGLAVPLLAIGAALIASGRRLGVRVATLLALVAIAWSVADALLHTHTSPATWLGTLALWPVEPHPAVAAVAGLVVALAAVVLGLRWVGGTSLEASLRRAALVAELRFAVTLQDLRTVVLLRRRLAAEDPRARPWLRLRRDGPVRSAVWRRDWQGILRWPAVRVARLTVLGMIAGACAVGAWAGTTPLVVISALALLVAAFDAIDPFAQEVDHPGLTDMLPADLRRLALEHLAAPAGAMLLVVAVGVLTAFAAGAGTLAFSVGIPVALCAAAGALCGAAFSVTSDPFSSPTQPALQYVRVGAPFVLALIGFAPGVAARVADHHGHSAGSAAVGLVPIVAIACAIAIWWVRRCVDRAAKERLTW